MGLMFDLEPGYVWVQRWRWRGWWIRRVFVRKAAPPGVEAFSWRLPKCEHGLPISVCVYCDYTPEQEEERRQWHEQRVGV